jgi:pyruvate formate lyase activating enzyme
MRISGFIKNSFLDYPGQIASVLFVPHCNMNCYYCHNKHLLNNEVQDITKEEIFGFLKNRREFIDAVVISGGEPTIYSDLKQFISEIKDMGFLVKLDSNGMKPGAIKELLDEDLLSYIAIDYKAPLEKYTTISDKGINKEKFKKTVDLLLSLDIEYEFRTTFVPDLDKEDILQIAEHIKGAKSYYLQQFRPLKEVGQVIDLRAVKRPHSKEYLFMVQNEVKKVLTTTKVELRGVK